MKKIAVADLGEFWYGDYKEPLIPFEGGYGYVGALLKDDQGALLCSYSGKVFHNLGGHVAQKHRISAADYKREVGLLQKSALVSEKGRLSRIRNALHLQETGQFDITRAAQTSMKREHHSGKANGLWNPEYLNKTGRCYEQVLATARTVLRERGRITQKLMGQHGIGPLTVRTYFGSWEELRRVAGDGTSRDRRWTDRELLVAFRSLAEQLGRTPTQSDLNRYGLPASSLYRHFGSLTEAASRAGIPPNLPTPHDDDWAVRVLTAYAVLGRTDRTAEQIGTTHKAVAALFARYGCPIPLQAKGESLRLRREWAAEMARRLAKPVAA